MLAFLWAEAAANEFVLVVHTTNNAASITRKQAERMFLSKTRSWPDGSPVTVVINSSRQVHTAFCSAVLKRTPRQFSLFQKKRLFRGQGMPPAMVTTDEDVIEFVSSRPDALGYVSPGAATPAVKILPLADLNGK